MPVGIRISAGIRMPVGIRISAGIRRMPVGIRMPAGNRIPADIRISGRYPDIRIRQNPDGAGAWRTDIRIRIRPFIRIFASG